MFPAAPNVPLTRSMGLLNAVGEVFCVDLGGCPTFLLRGPRTGGSGKVPASVWSSSDKFRDLGNMVSSPQACERSMVAGGSDSAFVPRAIGHGYASMWPSGQPSHHLHTRASNNGLKILTQEEKLQLCICGAGNRTIERPEGLVTARSKHPFQH